MGVRIHGKFATSLEAELNKHDCIAYFVSLGLSDEEASELHSRYYTQYGLALRGLRRHHNVGSASYRFSSRQGVEFAPLRSTRV